MRVAKPEDIEALNCGVQQLDLNIGPNQLEQICQYLDLLRRWNSKFNLISRRDEDRLVARHILDCLTIVPMVRGPNLLDIGSGAGFPGLLVAVARPDLEICLLDRHQRKTRFLKLAARAMGLTNVEVVCENLSESLFLGPFGALCARGVGAASTLWVRANHLIAPEGRLIVMQRTQDQDNIALDIPGTACSSHWVEIPGLNREHEIVTVERLAG
ncbi:MAG: 16S rRNA (guanine(527)-N(7))-methyltransferase RsmG [Gammaproteobacteria bacterium]|jgi:16S rRNA (guanine527-N7)-methyltransferase|nr:16S rRNA (guanine(527)-N(7))-methyltransferase RsmG [Gammaproteobacteria bacterium]